MKFQEILERQRGVYLRQLVGYYSSRQSGVKELLLELKLGASESIFNLYRVDYAVVGDDSQTKIEELSPDTYIDHAIATFETSKLQIELHPFYWHGCKMTVLKPGLLADRCIQWAEKWIDLPEVNSTDINGLSNVIHSISISHPKNDQLEISIDLGSAEVRALEELILLAEETGAEKIIIESSIEPA